MRLLAIAVCIMGVVNVITLVHAITVLSNSNEELAEQYLKAVSLVLAAESSLNRAVSAERTAILVSPDKPRYSTLKTFHQQNIQTATDNLSAMENMGFTASKISEPLSNTLKNLDNWQAMSSQVFVFRDQNTRDSRRSALKMTMEDANYAFAELSDTLQQLVNNVEAEAKRVAQHSVASAKEQRNFAVAVVVISVAVIVAIAMLLSMSVTRSLFSINRNLSNIATGEGDLTQRLPIEGAQELREIATSFNLFCENQSTLLAQIKNMLGTINDATNEVGGSMSTMNTSSQSQQQDSEIVNERLESLQQAFTLIRDITQKASNLSIDSHKVVEAADQSLFTALNLIDKMREGITRMSQAMDELNVRTSDINKVTNQIRAIAEKTDLLSLNAAIEAARAQEHGRGFAVVAEEVRNLSTVTQKMTRSIEDNLSLLLTTTQDAHNIMADNLHLSTELDSGAVSTRDQMQTLKSISEQYRQASQEVSSGVAEQLTTIENTTQKMNDLKQLANDSSRMSKEVKSNMMQLNELSHHVFLSLEKIKTEK